MATPSIRNVSPPSSINCPTNSSSVRVGPGMDLYHPCWDFGQFDLMLFLCKYHGYLEIMIALTFSCPIQNFIAFLSILWFLCFLSPLLWHSLSIHGRRINIDFPFGPRTESFIFSTLAIYSCLCLLLPTAKRNFSD